MKLRSVLALLALNGAGMKWKQKERKKEEREKCKQIFISYPFIDTINIHETLI